MKQQKDTLLQQIAEDSRESTVFLVAAHVDEHRTGRGSRDTEMSIYAETGTGFFVAPDKIVTTLGTLAGPVAIAGIPADYVAKAGNHKWWNFRKRNPPQISEEEKYTLEGVTAFDAKNNLALLKTAETGVPLRLGNSDTAEINENVYMLGYKNETEYTSVTGMLQSRYRNDKRLQLKITFFPGNGGAPVLNSKNEVIGVAGHGTTSAERDSHTTITTAIASNVLKELLAKSGKIMPLVQLQKHSRVRAYALEMQADKKTELSDNTGAMRDYNAALKSNPDLVEIYFKRGILKTRIGNTTGALKDFDKMIQINPAHVFAYNNRASAKGNLGDIQGTLDDLNKATTLNPEYGMAYMNLGGVKCEIARLKTDAGDIGEARRYYQEATDAYTKALTLNPRNRLARKSRRMTKSLLWLLKFQQDTTE